MDMRGSTHRAGVSGGEGEAVLSAANRDGLSGRAGRTSGMHGTIVPADDGRSDFGRQEGGACPWIYPCGGGFCVQDLRLSEGDDLGEGRTAADCAWRRDFSEPDPFGGDDRTAGDGRLSGLYQ